MATTTTRDLVHHLIDELPDALLEEAARRLTDLRDDRFLRAFLEAPEDDEPLTEEDIAAIEEGKAAIGGPFRILTEPPDVSAPPHCPAGDSDQQPRDLPVAYAQGRRDAQPQSQNKSHARRVSDSYADEVT